MKCVELYGRVRFAVQRETSGPKRPYLFCLDLRPLVSRPQRRRDLPGIEQVHPVRRPGDDQHTLSARCLQSLHLRVHIVRNAAQQAALTSYFVAKGWPGPYLSQIGSEISGAAPFFFLKAADGVYTLVDGFTRGLGGGDASLRIDDDYPASAYQYAGTLIGSNGAILNLTIVMKVVRMP